MCVHNSNCASFELLLMAYLHQKYIIPIMFTLFLILFKQCKCACVSLSALPIFFVAIMVVDGVKPTGYFNIIANYLNY